MSKYREIILITVKGHDAPGITSKLTEVIAAGKGVKILDIEQTVVHGKLVLSILLGFMNGSGKTSPVLKDLLFVAKEIGIHLDFEVFDEAFSPDDDRFQYIITCLGDEIGAKEISSISTSLAKYNVNIDKISRLSHANIRCIEMVAHSTKAFNPKILSKRLLPLSSEIGVDIAIQKFDLLRQAKRLVVIDMDSTLIQNEVIDELAKVNRVGKKVKAITNKALDGKLSFDQALKARVKLLKGLNEQSLEKVYKKIKLTTGAVSFIKVLNKIGYKTALISGGFTFFTEKLQKKLGFDYAYANELEVVDGKLTGKIVGHVIDGKRKASLLRRLAKNEGIMLNQTIAIGDGANDIDMLSIAGLGIAFQARPALKEKAHYAITKHKGLDSILYLLGIPEKAVREI